MAESRKKQVLARWLQELKLILNQAEAVHSEGCGQLYLILAPVENMWSSLQLPFTTESLSMIKKAASSVAEFAWNGHQLSASSTAVTATHPQLGLGGIDRDQRRFFASLCGNNRDSSPTTTWNRQQSSAEKPWAFALIT